MRKRISHDKISVKMILFIIIMIRCSLTATKAESCSPTAASEESCAIKVLNLEMNLPQIKMQACLGFKINLQRRYSFSLFQTWKQNLKNWYELCFPFLAEEFDNIILLYEIMQIKWRQMRGSSYLSDMPLMLMRRLSTN